MNTSRGSRSRTWLFSGAAALGLLVGGAGVAAAANGGGPLPFRHLTAQDAADPTPADSAASPQDQDQEHEGDQADEGDEGDESASLSALATISPDEARAAALAVASGSVGNISLENENGSVVYSVIVGTSDVKVDATTGAVLKVDNEHDGGEAADGSEADGGETGEQADAATGGESDDSGQSTAASGSLDDGADLLPQAGISLDQAIAAARSAATGAIGEVDLEHYQGRLVFNVDVGNQDVKVDASTGAVLGMGTD